MIFKCECCGKEVEESDNSLRIFIKSNGIEYKLETCESCAEMALEIFSKMSVRRENQFSSKVDQP